MIYGIQKKKKMDVSPEKFVLTMGFIHSSMSAGLSVITLLWSFEEGLKVEQWLFYHWGSSSYQEGIVEVKVR